MKKIVCLFLMLLTAFSLFGFTFKNENYQSQQVTSLNISGRENKSEELISERLNSEKSVIVYGSEEKLGNIELCANPRIVEENQGTSKLFARSFYKVENEIFSHDFYVDGEYPNDHKNVTKIIEEKTVEDIANIKNEVELTRSNFAAGISSSERNLYGFSIGNDWNIIDLWKKESHIWNKKPNWLTGARELHTYTQYFTFAHKLSLNGQSWYAMFANYSITPDYANRGHRMESFKTKVDFNGNNPANKVNIMEYGPKVKPGKATNTIGGSIDSNATAAISFSSSYESSDLTIADRSSMATNEMSINYSLKNSDYAKNTQNYQQFVLVRDDAKSASIYFWTYAEMQFRKVGDYDDFWTIGRKSYKVVR